MVYDVLLELTSYSELVSVMCSCANTCLESFVLYSVDLTNWKNQLESIPDIIMDRRPLFLFFLFFFYQAQTWFKMAHGSWGI